MCRITGIFDLSSSMLKQDVLRMRDSMQHGGPDDEGLYIDDQFPLALGHRRLSLIDLSSAGHQPMSDADGMLQLIFNGEIYNFQELKQELQSFGFTFKTKTDTEVILKAYIQWGSQCFEKFNGMFTIALWNKKDKEIIIARDHAGIKPLYYSIDKDRLIFASEIRAFKAYNKNWPENPEWKIPFLTFGHLPEPFTTLQNVQPLAKGTYAVIKIPSLKITHCRFNKFEFSDTITKLSDAVSLIKNKLEKAVERHLISDAPIGLFLSGGIDSSLLTLIAHKYIGDNLKTLSIVFEDSTLNEQPFQKIIVDKTRAHHQSFLVTEKHFEEALPDILQAMDQPSTDGINSYFICKYAKQYGLTAVLSGIGADELFGGYASFNHSSKAAAIQMLPTFLPAVAENIPVAKLKKVAALKRKDHVGEYLFNRGFYSARETAELLSISERQVHAILDKVLIEPVKKTESSRNRAGHLETNLYMQNQLLKDTDYMSMWHSLEVRVPFLDKELMHAAYSIAPNIKFDKKIPKHLLIAAFQNILPKEIWQRKKQGFTFPFYKWMANVQAIDRSTKYRHIRYLYENNKLHWSRYWAYLLCNHFLGIQILPSDTQKVLFINLSTFSSTGGIEKFNGSFLKALKDIEAEKKIIADSTSLHDSVSDERYFSNINYKSFAGKKIEFVTSIIKDARYYDTIIVGHINLAMPALIIKLFKLKKKIILITHGIEIWKPLKGLKKIFLKKTDIILAVSNFTRQQIIKYQKIDSNKIKVFHNTIDPYFNYPDNFNKPQYLKERYNIKGEKIISTLTRLSSSEQYKGYDKVLQVLPQLKETVPSINYLICGKADEKEKKRVEAMIAESGLQKNVILTGFIDDKEIIDHYLLSDTFIMPSTMEGFGIVFIEAMACGVPVIAGNVDGSVDALNNGKFGTLVNPLDKEEILQSLKYVQQFTATEKRQLQEQIKQHFGFDVFKTKLNDILFPVQKEDVKIPEIYINTYASLKISQNFSVRDSARKITLDTIGLFDDFKNEKAFKQNRIQFLYVHHIFKDEEQKLRRLIEFLLEHHVFISYTEAIKRILTNEIDKPYICFSSDDGFKNNLLGAKILNEYGIKACFFICPSIIGDNNYDHIKSFCVKKLEFPPVKFLSWSDVDTLLMNGHEIGSHTMTHNNLRKAPVNILVDEVESSYNIIKKRCGTIRHFAFPYGRYFHFNEKGRQIVFETGYESCASAERGCHIKQSVPPVQENLLIRRDNIVIDWNLNHIKYFIRRNATNVALQHNNFIYN